MATLDDTVLDRLRELNSLRDRAKVLREQGRKALAKIPEGWKDKNYENLRQKHDLSNEHWVSGPHPIDVALLVRVLNHADLGDYEFDCPSQLPETLAGIITDLFSEDHREDRGEHRFKDAVPILTAARAMHALVRRPQTVFSTATMLCYYRVVREFDFAAFPNWIIGGARAGEGGRVSAFVTGECVRAILAFQDSIRHTITFFKTTKKLYEELERLNAIPNIDDHLKVKAEDESNWKKCLEIEFERVVLDWYAANDLRHNVIALDLSADSIDQSKLPKGSQTKVTHELVDGAIERSPVPSLFPLREQQIDRATADNVLAELPKLLKTAIDRAQRNIAEAERLINEFRTKEKAALQVTASSHDRALKVVKEALEEAKKAAEYMKEFESNPDLPWLLERFNEQYLRIYTRIHRIIEPAQHYIQDVLNRELAQAANSARFDAGELLFAAACFGALTNWKQNEQLAEARKLLTKQMPEDGRLQTHRPFQSTSQGLRLIPIAYEMTRCLAQLLQKDFAEDLDPKVVRKILNAFEEKPIVLRDDKNDKNDRIGWNFRGAPESQKPSVWVTAIAVFALDRTVKMLNERINAMVLRHFNVEWPSTEVESLIGLGSTSGGKLDLNELMYGDYELHSAFEPSHNYDIEYQEDPHRMQGVSIAIRLQQMRAHLTRALLPAFYSRKSSEPKYQKGYSAILYGPPGTGKTTLAEALATTAKVPIVRLSPSDLMVQGTDVIESRARAIFDSLSMLTQAVIFLDEFEPVVRTRRDTGKARRDTPPDPPEFRFLVTGMLPKLIKLNKAAETQSVVYCLATNYLGEVDTAAKRVGRFDLQIPIYHPDPMSRLGVFFYRLITKLQEEGSNNWRVRLEELKFDPTFWDRVHESIVSTEEVSAQSLATIFFSTKETKSFFNYVLRKLAVCPKPTRERSTEEAKTAVEEDIESQRSSYEESWKRRSPPRRQLERRSGSDRRTIPPKTYDGIEWRKTDRRAA